jgi:hypothetical protein
MPTEVRIESVGVRNVTAQLPRARHADEQPCALLMEDVDTVSSAEPLEFGGRTYRPTWSGQSITILTSD